MIRKSETSSKSIPAVGTQFLALRSFVAPSTEKVSAGVVKAVLRAIHDHAGGGRSCTASAETIAREIQFSRRSVRYAFDILEEGGFVHSEDRPGKTNSVRINWERVTPPLHQLPGSSPNAMDAPLHQLPPTLASDTRTLAK